jgi:hypothetical protein
LEQIGMSGSIEQGSDGFLGAENDFQGDVRADQESEVRERLRGKQVGFVNHEDGFDFTFLDPVNDLDEKSVLSGSWGFAQLRGDHS